MLCFPRILAQENHPKKVISWKEATEARTRIATLEKWLRRLQPQGVPFFGAMLAEVSDASIAKVMTRLMV